MSPMKPKLTPEEARSLLDYLRRIVIRGEMEEREFLTLLAKVTAIADCR